MFPPFDLAGTSAFGNMFKVDCHPGNTSDGGGTKDKNISKGHLPRVVCHQVENVYLVKHTHSLLTHSLLISQCVLISPGNPGKKDSGGCSLNLQREKGSKVTTFDVTANF